MKKASRPVVLITGVSGGIGLATAKLFAAEGWIVVGTVRGRTRMAALRGAKIDVQVAEMLKPRDLERVVKTAWQTYGRLDAVVCNAGYGLVAPLDAVDYAQMNEQLTVNTLAPAELARQAAPLMRRQGSGVIVGVSSIAGRVGLPGYSLYVASKFGLEGLFESLAMELAPAKVRVKLVEPSRVHTGFWTGVKGGVSHFGNGMPPEAVAKAIYRAATDAGSRLRYPLGYTRWLNYAQRLLPQQVVQQVVQRMINGH